MAGVRPSGEGGTEAPRCVCLILKHIGRSVHVCELSPPLSSLCPAHTTATVAHFISSCTEHDPVAVATPQKSPSRGLVQPDRTQLSTEMRSEMKL